MVRGNHKRKECRILNDFAAVPFALNARRRRECEQAYWASVSPSVRLSLSRSSWLPFACHSPLTTAISLISHIAEHAMMNGRGVRRSFLSVCFLLRAHSCQGNHLFGRNTWNWHWNAVLTECNCKPFVVARGRQRQPTITNEWMNACMHGGARTEQEKQSKWENSYDGVTVSRACVSAMSTCTSVFVSGIVALLQTQQRMCAVSCQVLMACVCVCVCEYYIS